MAGLVFGSSGLAAQSAGSEYETLTVSANERRVITVGSGETLENKLIDISASGATFRIEAYGSDWTVRNIGVKGEWDVSSSGHEQAISCRVDDGTGVIENYYFADGVPDDTFPGVTGVYVQKAHSGTLTLRNVNLQNLPNNGIYASSPGASDGGQGVVEVKDSYFADNLAASVRLGTDGSYARNCVVNGGRHRGFWAYWRRSAFENCSAIAGNPWDAGGPSHDLQSTAVAALTDCRGEGDLRERGGGVIDGEMRSDPRTEPPEGVPLSPTAAAAGGGNSSGGDADGDATETATAREHTLTVSTASDNQGMSYEFTIDGTVTGGSSLEDPDSSSMSGGTTTATGEVGWGYTDSYTFVGSLTGWTASEDDSTYTVLVDDQAVDPSQNGQSGEETEVPDDGETEVPDDGKTEVPDDEERILIIDGTSDPDTTSRYDVSVSGSISKDVERSSTEDGGIPWDDLPDTTESGTAVGIVGNGVDAYRFTGAVTDIDIRGNTTFTIVGN